MKQHLPANGVDDTVHLWGYGKYGKSDRMEEIQDSTPHSEVYQFRVWLRQISPMIWRRLLLLSDNTLADLHYAIQIAFGWSDEHLHRFAFRCGEYGIYRPGCLWFTADTRQMSLADLHLRPLERFTYEYDFTDSWVHEVRLEQKLPIEARNMRRTYTGTYPICIGGARAGPPEDCGGPWAYMAQRQHYSPFFVAEQVSEMLHDGTIGNYREEVLEMCRWLECHRFDRRTVNHPLHLYATGGEWWMEG